MGRRRVGGWFLSGASFVGAILMDRLIPDPLPYWLTAALFAVVIIGFFGGLALALWPERKMSDSKKPVPGTVGIKIGPGANQNRFIGFRMRGVETAIENDGDGNHFENFDVDTAPEASKADKPDGD